MTIPDGGHQPRDGVAPEPAEGPRRDPRRLFSANQRTHIADRQHHVCAECNEDLPEVFHVHHVVPWSEGGRTDIDNGVAVCVDCHITAKVRQLEKFEPRRWQQEAMGAVLPQLRGGEFATVSAAPGAGKTLFAAAVYRQLADAGDVGRVVVFVPNANLRTQWADDVKQLNVFLHTKGTTEKRSYDGVVLTYHTLSDAFQVQQIMADAEEEPTLFVLDEVHHLAKDQSGQAGSWAVNIGRIVGSDDHPRHRVLNLSGTLFRSNMKERISTIKYKAVGDRIDTLADYVVSAGTLISEQQLRHIKVLGFDADMRVEAIDLSEFEDRDMIRAVDIDANSRLRGPLISKMVRDERYLEGMIQETVSRLGHSSVALQGAPVKGLIIADSINHAEQVYSMLADEVGPHNAFIAHGDMSTAEAEIQRFRLSTDQAIMVAVQKITEGFDVPDICVLAYLRSWRAPLFINQMVGRAMRVTQRERELESLLPATILVPNDSAIKAAFADVLVGAMRVLDAPAEPCLRCGELLCSCPPRRRPTKPWNPKDKICQGCDRPWMMCICECDRCGRSRATGCMCWRNENYPVDLEVVGDVEIADISLDGRDVDLHMVVSLRGDLDEMGIPEVHLEQVAASVMKRMDADPMAFMTFLRQRRGETE
jgi:superfamily II DNA or RNA helicase